MASIIIGLLFVGLLSWAFIRARSDIKSNKCSGCGSKGSCSMEKHK